MARTREAPSTAVEIFNPSAPEVVGTTQVSGHILAVTDEAARAQTSTPGDLIREHSSLLPGRIPGASDITHPDVHMEVFRPTFARAILQQQGIHSAIQAASGRIADFVIETKTEALGGPDTQQINGTILHRAFMQGDLGMRKDVAKARKRGELSPSDLLVGEPRDIGLLFRLDRQRINCFNKAGEYVLESILDGSSVLPEDIFFEVAKPETGKRNEDDSFSYANGFIASYTYKDESLVAAAENQSTLFKGMFRFLKKPNSRSTRSFLTAVSKSYLDPTYDYRKDRHVKEPVRVLVEHARAVINAHQGAIAEPLRAFLRADMLMEELDGKAEQLGPRSRASVDAMRKRIMSDLVRTFRYLDKISGLGKMDQRKSQDAQDDFSLPTSASARFEILAFDHIDKQIAEKADEAIKKTNASTHHRDLRVLNELSNHLFGAERPRASTFAVRGLGTASIRFLTNLSTDDDTGKEKPGELYNGTGIPHAVNGGHYGHEIIQSLIEPFKKSKYFPIGGLAMAGVVFAFEVTTPERDADPKQYPAERFLLLAAEEAPNMFRERILDRVFSRANRDEAEVRKLLDGSTTLTSIYTEPRTQAYEFAIEDGQSHHLELAEQTLYNGSTLALAFDAENNVYPDIGHIRGQKPKIHRTPVPARGSKLPSAPLREKPVYVTDRKGNRTGELKITDEEGNTYTVDNRLVEFIFADGAVYVRQRDDENVRVGVSNHFASLAPAEKRGFLRRR